MLVKLDPRPRELCPFCRTSGGVVYRVLVYELHMHIPAPAIQADWHNCTLLVHDDALACKNCHYYAELHRAT